MTETNASEIFKPYSQCTVPARFTSEFSWGGERYIYYPDDEIMVTPEGYDYMMNLTPSPMEDF